SLYTPVCCLHFVSFPTRRSSDLDNFSKVMGKHTLKFGADVRYIQVNERNTYTSNGWFQFSGTETGNDFADFLLGAPDKKSAKSLDRKSTRLNSSHVSISYAVFCL